MPCMKCQSNELIPDVIVVDSLGVEGSRPLEAVVHRRPETLLMKGTERGQLRAVVCGECGYTELYVTKHRNLLAAHRAAQASDGD